MYSRGRYAIGLAILICGIACLLWVLSRNRADIGTPNDGIIPTNFAESAEDNTVHENRAVNKYMGNARTDSATSKEPHVRLPECDEASIPDNTRTSRRVAPPGFYIALDDNRSKVEMYADSSKDLSPAFGSSGYPAFYGGGFASPHDSSPDLEYVEKSDQIPLGWGTLFVGPFNSDAAARDRLPKIISILKRHIPKDNTVGIEGDDSMTIRSYVAKIVHVKTNRIYGTLARLRPADFMIRPGKGVGRILIGMGPCEILSVLGRPRNSVQDSDHWSWADPGRQGGLGVTFLGGTVSEISITDPLFHTASGLRPGGRSQSFRKAFPATEGYSCGGGGSGGFPSTIVVHAVRNGIIASYDEDSFRIEEMTVYRMGKAVSQDRLRACEKIW